MTGCGRHCWQGPPLSVFAGEVVETVGVHPDAGCPKLLMQASNFQRDDVGKLGVRLERLGLKQKLRLQHLCLRFSFGKVSTLNPG